MNRRKADAALAANTVIWGSTFLMVKSALNDVSPLVFLALRFGVAALALLALFRGVKSRLTRGEIGVGALVGLFLFSGYALQTVGLQFTTPPKSAFLTSLTSVLVPLLAALVYRTKPQASELLGVLVATAGVGLMSLEGPVGAINRGDLLTVGCALAFAAQIVTQGHYAEEVDYQRLSLLQMATAALLGCLLFWWAEPVRLQWRPFVVYAVVATGLLATALTFTLQAWAQRYTTSTRTALIYMLEPVVAWLTSYLVAGEGLSRRAATGAGLILGGVLMVELKPFRFRLHPSE